MKVGVICESMTYQGIADAMAEQWGSLEVLRADH